MKWQASLLAAIALISGCASDEPVKKVEKTDSDLSTDEMRERAQEDYAIAEPVELPEGTIDLELVGAWLARFTLDQEKYDAEPKENQVAIEVMVSDMNASQRTFELMVDGTFTLSASIPDNPRNPGGGEIAGNTLMKGVWCLKDGKLTTVLREYAYSELGEELPEPTPIRKYMARGALQTYVLSDDRKSFSQGPVGRDDLYYFPMVVAYHKEE